MGEPWEGQLGNTSYSIQVANRQQHADAPHQLHRHLITACGTTSRQTESGRADASYLRYITSITSPHSAGPGPRCSSSSRAQVLAPVPDPNFWNSRMHRVVPCQCNTSRSREASAPAPPASPPPAPASTPAPGRASELCRERLSHECLSIVIVKSAMVILVILVPAMSVTSSPTGTLPCMS